MEARRPARGEEAQDPGRVRRREGAALGARGVAARGARRRGRGGARDRRPSGRRGGAGMSATELERAVAEVLIDEDALQRRVAELGAEISADYAGRQALLVGVLKGAVFFLADLMRHLTVPCEIDFMAISSYGASTDSSGVVRILKDLDINIEGRHVLVVEDIIDSGLTLSYLVRTLEAREPASLEVCALLTKPERREIEVPVRYTGFEIPHRDTLVNRFFRSALFPLVIIAALVWLALQTLGPHTTKSAAWTTSKFIETVRTNPTAIQGPVSIDPNHQSITFESNGSQVTVHYASPQSEAALERLMEARQVSFNSKGIGSSPWWSILTSLLPVVPLFGFWIFLMHQVEGGGSKVMSFGKSRAKRMTPDSPKIGFKDVAGVDEAVEELQEIKEFLENPKKFQALGARIPKGVLLYGPPGTGKTLLARAVAGEAGVPFFSISGSDFVEMFVGVGASRVRDLFEQAKQNSPCIIFMDEIDAVGRHRGAGLGGGHDEREQTLNQLLVEMDGFEAKDNIIMIAATNRPDILDPALLRPGRFDRQIAVDRPDRKGRVKILEVHTRGKPLGRDIDIDALAAQTPGFTGADLANLINEAALLAARTGRREITQIELEEGIMRVIAGPERKTRVMSEKERLITAYHEMGHAIVGHFLENADPVHKISVISRGQALGYTISLPTEDRFLTTKAELEDMMAMTLGGRAAEELVFGEVTSGASNDLEKVTQTAKQMVMRYGMSERLGPRVFGHDHSQLFFSRTSSTEPDYSDEIAREIDDEVRSIVEAAHKRALDILSEHRADLDRISEILVRRETIERDEFESLLAGRSEEEVFGSEEPAGSAPLPAPPERAPRRRERDLPRTLPRPGLAGGAAES